MSKKNRRQPIKNIPVFTTGQMIAATIVATTLFFFSIALYTAPAKRPASAPFRRTVTTVPPGLTAKKAAALPEIQTVIPNARPSHAPDNTP